MKGYKVVGVQLDGTRVSYVYGLPSAVEYSTEKPAVPLQWKGPLAVFDTENDARNFLQGQMQHNIYRPTELWECEYTEEIKEKTLHYTVVTGVQTEVIRFGVREENTLRAHAEVPLDRLPPGTRLASSVLLTRRILQVEPNVVLGPERPGTEVPPG